MTKKELRKISLQYRTLSAQMLQIDSQEEINYMQMYYDFITNTPLIHNYITECHKTDYDFDSIIANKDWHAPLRLPSRQDDLIDYCYQLIEYILDGPKQLFSFGHGYSSSNKFKDLISAFIRKAIEPFVVAIRSYLEIELIDADDNAGEEPTKKTIFLSYCQKDKDIADIVDDTLLDQIGDKAVVSRDIRDVAYHQSFKHFMNSIGKHDYVLIIASDNYLKSRNCMYEILEILKDSRYGEKLAFIVLQNEDKKYYKITPSNDIGANIYSTAGQTEYYLYWQQQDKNLQRQIEKIGNPAYTYEQAKEKNMVMKILLDIQEIMQFLKDRKSVPFTNLVEKKFNDIIKFMGL